MKLVEMWQLAGNDGHQADFYLASFELGEATRLPRSPGKPAWAARAD
ncbi:hypothetical protein AB4851_10515 [Burkholderia sp. 22PA0099]